ncbi:hypothetical protein BGX34_005729 [Mortierella sp. NVP85]|nr:hypothetical protein BGX34_005729 [Mortierella sp. NVP85]
MFTSVSETRSEKDFFDHCWAIANPFGSPLFFGDQAISFFSKSGLEKNTLGQIWHIVDDKNHGYLDRQQFDKALRLIGYAQRGFDISDPNRTCMW